MESSDLLSEQDVSSAQNLGKRTPTLVIIEAPSLLAEALAETLAKALVPTLAARNSDVRVLSPASASWVLDEIDQQIVVPSSLTPLVRNVLVILNADQMSTRNAEHLLRATEEPPAPTTFIFCVGSANNVLATLRGRAQEILRPHLDKARLAGVLTKAGLSTDVATSAVELLGDQSALLRDLAQTPEGSQLATDFISHVSEPDRARPASTAAAVAAIITDIVANVPGAFGEDPAPTRLRARERALAASVIRSWTAAGPDFRGRAAGAELAKDVLDRNGPTNLALAAALA
jgi:hypothetical protein